MPPRGRGIPWQLEGSDHAADLLHQSECSGDPSKSVVDVERRGRLVQGVNYDDEPAATMSVAATTRRMASASRTPPRPCPWSWRRGRVAPTVRRGSPQGCRGQGRSAGRHGSAGVQRRSSSPAPNTVRLLSRTRRTCERPVAPGRRLPARVARCRAPARRSPASRAVAGRSSEVPSGRSRRHVGLTA